MTKFIFCFSCPKTYKEIELMHYFVLIKGNVVFNLTKNIKYFLSFVYFLSLIICGICSNGFRKIRVDLFLSDKLNQDPIEEHFGYVRGAGGPSDNPTI